MNGSQIEAVIDTNVIFMAFYNSESKAGKIIEAAIEDKIKLYSTDTVKEEIKRLLKRKAMLSDERIDLLIESLPITWIEEEIYKECLNKTRIKHKADKPLEALSLLLNCGILSADNHFKDSPKLINVNEFLNKIR